ncbi:hypothetical protein [Guptibacillus hwajinpoensis]|uniref:Uncharacterized protein n=1 Tax=Guptibacillus hwajinpoensis TaxID=208199 RepID=A0A0J6CT24_9BACL|nr:hypothetical protein [Alkalihalobacillus macyae]KMM39466.1 hypothetical protein AB986_09810 [Alkalihalobacillus macyae]
MKRKNNQTIPEELHELLDKYTVDVPPIPLRKNKLDQVGDFLTEPVSNPLDSKSISPSLLLKIQLAPIGVVLALSTGAMLLM